MTRSEASEDLRKEECLMRWMTMMMKKDSREKEEDELVR